MFRELKCSVCGCDLYGDLDTYGDSGAEQCEVCHNALMDEDERQINDPCQGGGE